MPTDRDPRSDPRPGDRLRKGEIVRSVSDTWSVAGKPYVMWIKPQAWFAIICKLSTWRRWAKGADVLEVAE